MMPSSKEVLEKLNKCTGERAFAGYLKRQPLLVFWTFFSVGGHMHYVIPEFGLGKGFRCDFVLMQSYSGGWHVSFVELEPVVDSVFNKDGTPSKRLRGAQAQIMKWQNYVHHDGASLRSQLADAGRNDDIFDPSNRNYEPSSYSATDLRDPMSYVEWDYYIVIGRRDNLSEDKRIWKNTLSHQSSYAIVSYDRFVDTAKGTEDYRSRQKN